MKQMDKKIENLNAKTKELENELRSQRVTVDYLVKQQNLGIDEKCIAFCYRIGMFQRHKIRPILITFTCRFYKNMVYKNKKLLKTSNTIIRENLISEGMKLLKSVRENVGNNRTIWTKCGNIFLKMADRN